MIKIWRFLRPAVVFFPAVLLAQVVNVGGAGSSLEDSRPFGKYLVRVCTLSTGGSIDCKATLSPSSLTKQTITLKHVCAPGLPDSCTPEYPLSVGNDFYIKGTSDSGLPVPLDVTSGNVTLIQGAGPGTQKYHVDSGGTIVVRATQRGDAKRYAPAVPVELMLTVSSEKIGGGNMTCAGLLPPPAASQVQSQISLTDLITLIGNPTPFVLAAQGNNTILIYSTRYPLRSNELAILETISASLAQLAGQTPASLGLTATPAAFTVELKINHAAALGDLAARIATLNYSGFTVQDIASDHVRISATKTPDCDTWTAFLSAIRNMQWQVTPEPFELKLYYLSSSDAATAFTALAGSSTASTTTASASPAATNTTSASAATPASTTTAAGAGAATLAINQPPGSVIELKSDTTPCVVAGLTAGNSAACSSGSSSASAGAAAAPSSTGTTGTSPPKPTPPAMATMAVATGTGEQNPSDLLVFSDANPGDDAQIVERKRILALLDLPRPEMMINAWVMQNSTANASTIGKFSNMIRDLVSEYNGAVEDVALLGWASLKRQMELEGPTYFNQEFYHYIADHYVADSFSAATPSKPQATAQKILDFSPAQLADNPAVLTRDFGICPAGQYCLGYSTLFEPLKPNLTHFLLTLIAAQHPGAVVAQALADVEGRVNVEKDGKAPGKKAEGRRKPGDEEGRVKVDEKGKARARKADANGKPGKGKGQGSVEKKDDAAVRYEKDCDGPNYGKDDMREPHQRCRAIWTNLGLNRELPSGQESCASTDYKYILGALGQRSEIDYEALVKSILAGQQDNDHRRRPRIYLNCFSQAAKKYLSNVSLLRGAIADFLFNYKMSQQYPHEFAPYELSQSADALNAALSPLIDAFNRDIIAFQTFMRADIQYQVDRLNSDNDERCCVKRLFGLDKPSFFNDGLVTVRTISGQPTTVNTTSQSSLDASTAPTLSNLLSSMTATTGSGAGTSPLAAALGSTNGPALLAGVLNAYQSTSAQIGRAVTLQVTPRSLSTASSAELAVTLNADETGSDPAYPGGPVNSAAQNTSRVANHDVTTRIRVESVKLFELSSLSATVQRSRSRFPLLPPFVEIPYIGTIAGIPIPAAKEYHSSTAVISAMVVPTAADIAYGLRFLMDQVVDGDAGTCSYLTGSAGSGVAKPCRFKRAVAMTDLDPAVRSFHRLMINCFATDMRSPYSSLGSVTSSPAGACANLKFDRVPH